MEITAKEGIGLVAGIVVALVLSFIGGNLTAEQLDVLYYCQVEDSVKECSELTKYGVEDSVCVFPFPDEFGRASDRCTKNRVYYPWKPARDYLDVIIPKGAVVVESRQDCHIEYKDVSELVMVDCYTEAIDYSNCLKEISNASSPTDKSCAEWETYNQTYGCKKPRTITKNQTVCNSLGFNINYSNGRTYQILHDCCGYYNESPYRQFTGYQLISCKVKVKDICNPLIQQSSKDPSVYDEPGRIFVITADGIKPYLVGANEYVLNNDIYMGKVEGIK